MRTFLACTTAVAAVLAVTAVASYVFLRIYVGN